MGPWGRGALRDIEPHIGPGGGGGALRDGASHMGPKGGGGHGGCKEGELNNSIRERLYRTYSLFCV